MIHRFEPSRFSKGNHVFQTTIEIDDSLHKVTCRRPRLIGSKTVTFNVRDILSTTLNSRTEYLYLSEITLTISRAEIIVLNGFTLRDARAIKEIIDRIKID